MAKVMVDEVEYDTDALSKEARAILGSLLFAEQGLAQRKNELAVADTARLAYRAVLKKEMARLVKDKAEAAAEPEGDGN